MGELFQKASMLLSHHKELFQLVLWIQRLRIEATFYLMANIETSLFAGENNWALLLDPDGFSRGLG